MTTPAVSIFFPIDHLPDQFSGFLRRQGRSRQRPMNEKLSVALLSADLASVKTTDSETQLPRSFQQLVQYLNMLDRIPDDSPFSHLSLPHLELRLEQAEHVTFSQELPDCRKHFENGDKRQIHGQ